jgi:hypothetical protein
MSPRLMLAASAGLGAVIAGTSVGLVAANANDGGSDVDKFDTTIEGVTYRCLTNGEGLWCERIWFQAPPSHDCGPNGDLECGPTLNGPRTSV